MRRFAICDLQFAICNLQVASCNLQVRARGINKKAREEETHTQVKAHMREGVLCVHVCLDLVAWVYVHVDV